MKRFLVVGCGGSGAVTLAYMMDQLRSDLGRWNIGAIPAGWQFVSIDVPTAPGGLPAGLRDVRDQGGSYFGAAPQGEKYSVLDNALSHRLRQKDKLGTIATWAPRDPAAVPVPVTSGAGQYRAVGRMITLSQASGIAQRLRTCWDRLHSQETDSEMRGLSFPGGDRYEPDDRPLVLVVSSMAGGSGASMALDVCRLLSMIPGLDPLSIGVFMVTADVFDQLGPAATAGVRPNSLAMLGEIIASQLGSARDHDVDLLSALGLQRGTGDEVPFGRVFPVSRTMGAMNAPFGDGTPEAIYRGLARGLAGLMMSGRAAAQFVDYDLTNSVGTAGERDHVGWGARYWDHLPWGSYGFSSLSMGRERYAEYAAQRLARSCVDRLLDGHTDPLDRATDDQQIDAILDSQWGTVLTRTGLGAHDLAPHDVLGWLTGILLPPHDLDRMIDRIAEGVLRPAIPRADGMHAKQWVPDFYAAMDRDDLRRRLVAACAREADVHAFEWSRRVTDAIVAEISDAIAAIGLPYATAVRHRLAVHIGDRIRAGAEDLAKHRPVDIADPPPAARQFLKGLRGTIKLGRPVIDSLVADYRPKLRQQVLAGLSAKIADLATAMVPDVLGPLLEALDDPHTALRAARQKPAQDIGLALLATDQYAAWPADSAHVPKRFVHANNEVMLTPSTQFAAQYAADLPQAVAGDAATPPPLAQATQLAATIVATGIWTTRDGSRAPGIRTPLIERTAVWRPKTFVLDPATGTQLPPPSPARFVVHLRSDEIIDRARAFVARQGESFDRFVKVSLREFLADRRETPAVLAQRSAEIQSRFIDALELARPLAGVDSEALGILHPNQPLCYRYKFSSIPFADMAIAADLLATLRNKTTMETTVETSFTASLDSEDGLTRIDIFGSFPNYSPLVFRSVLDPAARQWDGSARAQQTEFWKWRRARPLPAALPMHDEERRAMTAGWFLGLSLGLIQIPRPPYDKPVRIWDDEHGEWLDFPHPLLTPPDRLGPNDWLPAVLESILLAMAHAHDAPVLHSLRPYRTLRAIYDASPYDPAGGLTVRSAETLVTDWLRTGKTRSGAPRGAGIAEAATIGTRADALIEWFESVHEFCGTVYLPRGARHTPGGKFSAISSRELAAQTPLFRDLAPDVHRVTAELAELVRRCAPRAAQPDWPQDPDEGADSEPIVSGGPF
ncbi:tubulin-like doman-containing protein [Nocardia sp. alder85J]|uniref:tubulin-like doman-containing protein n=1 Tax=Nocardia sp. alder85J TaxID=2862949 RepID=UPI001CD73514|nr:tubulin-like doman-containing protein [Nocardia sp. alder85J]MCX4090923.1 tubulin-like doman-containing protein [Nocardia sp. alder85J]